jgi:carboxyl-terminal processing protease
MGAGSHHNLTSISSLRSSKAVEEDVHFNENSYVLKRAIALAAALSLIITLLLAWVPNYRTGADQASVSSVPSGTQFSLTSKQDLEKVYHEAWLAIGQNYAEQNRLAEWQKWEHRFDGQLRTEMQLRQAIVEMLSSLNDQHSVLLKQTDFAAFQQAHSGKLIGIGVSLTKNHIVGVLPNSPAQKAGLKAGDDINAVNGTSVSGMTPQQMVSAIRGPENTPVTITVSRNNSHANVIVTRAVVQTQPSVRHYEDSSVTGSIRIDNLRSDTVVQDFDSGLQALKSKPGLVLDLRGLKGGSISTAVQIAGRFMESGVITYSVQQADGKNVQLTYAVQDGKLVVRTSENGKASASKIIDSPVNVYRGKVVILVDEGTCGAAEIITAALQGSHRATVIGTTTRGKGSGQIPITLSNGWVLNLTTAVYYTPSMQPIESNGIKPDLLFDAKLPIYQRFGVAETELQKQLGQ